MGTMLDELLVNAKPIGVGSALPFSGEPNAGARQSFAANPPGWNGLPPGKRDAVAILSRLAEANGIDWHAARSQMIDGDTEAAMVQLEHDTEDGVELRCVVLWLRLLAERGVTNGGAG